MITFTALPVNQGDAFLLQNEREEHFLFDSGDDRNGILIENLLQSKKVSHLKVAICSHNDDDHAKGFINLLKSKTISIDELWLPAIWLPIVQTAVSYPSIKKFLEEVKDAPKAKAKDLPHTSEDCPIRYKSTNNKEAMRMKEVFTHANIKIEYVNNFCNDLQKIKQPPYHIGNIFKIFQLAHNKNIRVRFFLPINDISQCLRCSRNCYYNFVPLNSIEVTLPVSQSISKGINVIQLLSLTLENRYSLVFSYHLENGQNPVIKGKQILMNNAIVLFTADSDLMFLCPKKQKNCNPTKCKVPCRKLIFQNNVLITAPHHGSENNDCAYNKIVCNNADTQWVRTHNSAIKTLAQSFIQLKNRQCQRCLHCKKRNVKPIKLKYQSNIWMQDRSLKGYKC